MSRRAFLHVAGIPAPKGSRTVGTRRDGSHYTRESSKAAGPWSEQVAYAARANRPGGRTLEPPYTVELEFSMPTPQRSKHEWPSKSDVDKLTRLILDALVVGGLLVDDRHVVKLIASKRFGTPGVAISIS